MTDNMMPAFPEPNIPVIFASNDQYMPYLSVALTSIIENSSAQYHYDLLVLTREFSQENQERLQGLLQGRKNISLRFIDLNTCLTKMDLPVSMYFSVDSYSRLFIPQLLTQYSKVIYLDCDLVADTDIAALWQIDIGDRLLGAVRDVGLAGASDSEKARTQFCPGLGKVNSNDYFNSGVLLMNLETFREQISPSTILEAIGMAEGMLVDQDVLNYLCAERVFFLDSAWNCQRDYGREISDFPDWFAEEFASAWRKPKIIHMCGWDKPLRDPFCALPELFSLFWEYACRSPLLPVVLEAKMETATITELEFILHTFAGEALQREACGHDLLYRFRGETLQRFSQIPAELLCVEIGKDQMLLQGTMIFESVRELENLQICLAANGQVCPTEMLEPEIWEEYAGGYVSKKVSFRGHVDLPGEKTTVELVCRFEGNEIVKSRLLYGTALPVDCGYQAQYYYKDGYKLTAACSALTLEKCGWREHMQSELRYWRFLLRTGKNYNVKAVGARLLCRLRKAFRRKPVWLIADDFPGGDAAAFYRFLREHHSRDLRVYFVSENEVACPEALGKKTKLLSPDSGAFRHMLLMSDCSVTGTEDVRFRKPFLACNDAYRDILYDRLVYTVRTKAGESGAGQTGEAWQFQTLYEEICQAMARKN